MNYICKNITNIHFLRINNDGFNEYKQHINNIKDDILYLFNTNNSNNMFSNDIVESKYIDFKKCLKSSKHITIIEEFQKKTNNVSFTITEQHDKYYTLTTGLLS